jgi:putative hydrolase of the HAD superfamily
MIADLLSDAFRSRDFRKVLVISNYRRIRERIAEAEVTDFERVLIAETASLTGYSEKNVQKIVAEWINHRPLPYLASCRYPGILELFDGLKRNGKMIGILSDYAAQAKIAALGLVADFVVCAEDKSVGVLKPHPRGIEYLMSLAGANAESTLLIGDRGERDGLAAERAGAHFLLRSRKPVKGWATFVRYDDPIFAPLLRS